MKLYEITESYKALIDMIEGEESFSSEDFTQALDELKGEFSEKAENIAKLITNMNADIKSLDEEEKRLKYKKGVLKKSTDSLKEYLKINMDLTGIKELKAGIFNLKVQKNPFSVSVIDEEFIPEKYFKVKKELDKSTIKELLKKGEVITGVELIQVESLRIK